MEQVRPVRIGLVGYGEGGRFFHAPLIPAARPIVHQVVALAAGEA